MAHSKRVGCTAQRCRQVPQRPGAGGGRCCCYCCCWYWRCRPRARWCPGSRSCRLPAAAPGRSSRCRLACMTEGHALRHDNLAGSKNAGRIDLKCLLANPWLVQVDSRQTEVQHIRKAPYIARGVRHARAAHVHLKPIWQQPPGSCVSVHCPGMEQPTELGPLQGLEAGMVYRQSGSVYSTGLAVCSERSDTPELCSSCGPARHNNVRLAGSKSICAVWECRSNGFGACSERIDRLPHCSRTFVWTADNLSSHGASAGLQCSVVRQALVAPVAVLPERLMIENYIKNLS